MRREEKFPNTDCFKLYNANPKNKYIDDCVIRAISTALNQSWESTYREMIELGIKYGCLAISDSTINRYLESKGWVKHKQFKKYDGTKYRGAEFCNWLKGTCYHNVIANIGTYHMVAIVEGVIYDTWDSSDGVVGNFWTNLKDSQNPIKF